MTNNSWKHQYFENSSKELHTNIFRNLEIEQYLQKTLKDNGFDLQDYKINFLHSKINILLLVCKTKQTNLNLNKNEIIKKIQKNNISSSLPDLTVKTKLQTLNLCKLYRKKVIHKKLKTLNLTNLSNQILQSLKLFTQNKQNIYLTIKEINFVNSNKETKQSIKTLFKFQKASFFKEGKRIITPITTQNSAKLLGNFIATQLKKGKKQHNFFLNFLHESLKTSISQKFSKIQGIKILIKGRIKNAARSQSRIIKLGKISLISKNSKINYSESTSFTSNGTIGVKVWISKKKNTNVFTTKKNKI